MLDITNDQYWVDENGKPLSALEIREKGAAMDFCTPVKPGDELTDLQELKDRYINEFIYIMKNMVYTQYLHRYTVGEDAKVYMLGPENLDTGWRDFISQEAVLSPPAQE